MNRIKLQKKDFSNEKNLIEEANDILRFIFQQKKKNKKNQKFQADSDSVIDLLDVCYKEIAYIFETDKFELEEIQIVQNSLEISIKSLRAQKEFSKELQDLNRILDSLRYDQNDQLKETLNQFKSTQNSKIQLNPNNKQQSLIFFQNAPKPFEEDPLRQSFCKDQFETQFRELFLKLDHNKQIVNPLQLVINKRIEAENPEVLFYVLSDQMRRANRAFFKSLQYDEKLMFSFHGQFTGESKDSQAYCITLQETSTLSYKNIASDVKFREEFINKFKKCIQIQFRVQEYQIQMIALEQGSIKVIFEIIDNAGYIHQSENINELQKLFPGTQPQISIHNYFKTAALSINDFAPNYNMVWDEFIFGNYDDRGPKGKTQPYFYPIGWKGYALNVAERYGNNDNWLMMNNNEEEWYVMFHGTNFNGFKGIMNDERKFRVGSEQAFEKERCMITKKVIGKGVYFSNHIEVCENYGEPTHIQDQQFKLAFQSRVKPESLRQCQKRTDLVTLLQDYKKTNNYQTPSLGDMKYWDNDYFLINKTCDIRPYRILLKKIGR